MYMHMRIRYVFKVNMRVPIKSKHFLIMPITDRIEVRSGVYFIDSCLRWMGNNRVVKCDIESYFPRPLQLNSATFANPDRTRFINGVFPDMAYHG